MKAIAAMASNRVIGLNGQLPWRIPGDLKFFKKMTTGCRCIVGRKTFETLPKLPDRRFVMMTKNTTNLDLLRDKTLKNNLVGVWADQNTIPLYGDDTWVIGGAEIYRMFLPHCTDLYLTRIFKDYEGDAFFPSFEHLFIQEQVIESNPEYAIVHYVKRGTPL